MEGRVERIAVKKKYVVLILLGILLLAAGVRIWGITYGLPCTYCRPDEDRLIRTSLRLTRDDPNPHYFIWPSFFFYFTRGLMEGCREVASWTGEEKVHTLAALYRGNPASFHLFMRFVFCGFGVMTIFFLYRLGKKMFSDRAGLIAAFFLSLSFLHGRDSHFAMLDIPFTLLAVVFFLKVWDVYKKGRWWDYLWAGLWGGLALATKYYGLILIVPLIAAHSLRPRGGGSGRRFRRLLIAGLLFLLILPLTSPYLLLDIKSAAREIKVGIFTSQYVDGFPLVPQLKTTRGWWYHLVFSLRYGLGLPLEIVCLLGVGYGLVRALRGRAASGLLISLILPFYLALAFQRSCFIRYVTVLLPFLCLFGAEFLVAAWSRGRSPVSLLAVAALLVVSESGYRLVRLDYLLSRPDSRNLASIWIEDNFPRGSELVFPHPLIFGRPPATFAYPERAAIPRGADAEFWKAFLPFAVGKFDFMVVDEHPIEYSRSDGKLKELLDIHAELVYRLDAYEEDGPPPVYDPFDAYYVPLAGFGGVKFPGPNISIYRLTRIIPACRQE